MTQTLTCFDIFQGNVPQLTLARFYGHFGPYPWVKLIGLSEVLNTLHLVRPFLPVATLQGLVRDELSNAAKALAVEGESLFPGGDWGSCNATQLRLALTGRPMCVEKAIIVAKATDMACRKAAEKHKTTIAIDVYNHLRIHASNCVLKGLDEWEACQRWPRRYFDRELDFLQDLDLKLRPYSKKVSPKSHAEAASLQRKEGFDGNYDLDALILGVMAGEAITFKTARILKKAFEAVLETAIEIRVLPSRRTTKLHACSKLEAAFIGLTLPELNILREELKLVALSA